MPVMDGIEATEKIILNYRSKNLNVPIIAMTANATPEDRDKCTEAGMTGFVTKPVTMASIREALTRWV